MVQNGDLAPKMTFQAHGSQSDSQSSKAWTRRVHPWTRRVQTRTRVNIRDPTRRVSIKGRIVQFQNCLQRGHNKKILQESYCGTTRGGRNGGGRGGRNGSDRGRRVGRGGRFGGSRDGDVSVDTQEFTLKNVIIEDEVNDEALPEDAGPKEALPKDADPEDAGPKEALPKDVGHEDAKEAVHENVVHDEALPNDVVVLKSHDDEGIHWSQYENGVRKRKPL
uniref:Uncharacterized protein n=1 Tax=Lactuca sativa TaxID=4236 RepID=A0A9R1UKE9_LACSA|nr:hypothetical protein LSAT_V11C900488750 [Lactuca sativa]